MLLVLRFLTDRRAATAVEYAVLLAVLTLVIVAGIGQAGNAVEKLYADNDRELRGALDP